MWSALKKKKIDFHEILYEHSNAKKMILTFHLAPPPGQDFNVYNTFVYDQAATSGLKNDTLKPHKS